MTAEDYRRRGWWRDTTFLDDLRLQARRQPRTIAIAGRRCDQARTDVIDYAGLARLTDRFAGALLELGVQRGDVVAARLPNRWELAPLMFACIAVGAMICPIAPECDGDELHHRLETTGARLLVTVASGYEPARATDVAQSPPPWADAGRPQLPSKCQLVIIGGATAGALDFEQHFGAAHRAQRRIEDVAAGQLTPDEPFVVLFTSGTTGFAKGVVHSQNTIYAGVRGYVDALLLASDLVGVVTTPLVHYSGFGQGVLAGVLLGATITFQDSNDPGGLLDLAEQYGANLVYGPPATLFAVAAAQRAEPRDISRLRYAVAGSAPAFPELVDQMRETLGADTHSVWGLSEFGPITVSRLDFDRSWAACSHGRPTDSAQVRFAPGSDGEPKVGRLQVRGASRALGYHKSQDAFEAQITSDGWFETGDIAREDGRGGVRILGRDKDAIRRDGLVAPVAELEAVLTRHPDLAAAALVSWSTAAEAPIVAVATLRGEREPSLDNLREHLLRSGQDQRFLPDRLVIVKELPTTSTGKIRKAALRRNLNAE